MPALADLCSHADWHKFQHEMLPRYVWQPEVLQQLREEHAKWLQDTAERRRMKAAAKADRAKP